MNKPAVVVAFMLASGAYASAIDKPSLQAGQAADGSRQVNYEISTGLALLDLQSCAIRELGRLPSVQVLTIPTEDGLAIELIPVSMFGAKGNTMLTVELHDGGDKRRVTLRYRRPTSAKQAVRYFEGLVGKPCIPGFVSPL